MNVQFNNKLMSSFMLTVDHTLLSQGGAFTNSSGLFYPVTGGLAGLHVYTTPFRQLVNDSSVTGAIQMTGIYVNGNFSQPGQNGLVSLNIEEGTAYFNTQPTTVSGVYAIKDFSVYLTTLPEEKLLFETKFQLRGINPQTLSGLPETAQTYPAVFLKFFTSENQPACFGGIENKQTRVRAMVVADSEYDMVAVCSIFESMAHKKLPIIDPTTLPFDALGGFTGVSYSYTNAISGVTDETWIKSAKTSTLLGARELNQLNPAIFPAFVDFELWTFMFPQ